MAIITVTDANEDPTCIPPPQLVIRIPENEAAGYPITHVEAVDHDLGKNAEMEFVIAKPKDLFQIHQENNTSAFITTKVSFDREQVIKYTIIYDISSLNTFNMLHIVYFNMHTPFHGYKAYL